MKDSYWFKHDSTSGRGTRLMRLQKIYGHWAKGVYWDVIEILRESDNYKYENNEQSIDVLSDLIRVDLAKFKSWFSDCFKIGLLQQDETHFWCDVLIDNMKEWDRHRENGKKGGRPTKKTKGLNQGVKPRGYNPLPNHNINKSSITNSNTTEESANAEANADLPKPRKKPDFPYHC